jgi:hypothetical protein
MYRSMFSWCRHQLEMCGQLHAMAALPPGKEPPVHIEEEVEWTPEPVWMRSRSENSWPYQDLNSNPSVIQPIASCYTDYGILALVLGKCLAQISAGTLAILIEVFDLWFSSFPLGKCHCNTCSDHDHFFPNCFHFIIHPMNWCCTVLILTASLSDQLYSVTSQGTAIFAFTAAWNSDLPVQC